MGRAVIYTRVSRKAQEDGYSLKVQERDGRSYCNTQGHEVVAVESDTFSGYDSLDERDGMQAAIKLIKRHDADALVIWRVDRAGRFMLDNLLLLREVSEAGGTFESVTEGIIPNTPMGKLLLSAHSLAGETEWESIRDRTQAGLTARIGKGHILPSAVPLYGYRWVGDRKETYAIDEESCPIVQDIYAKADKGWSTRRICQWLNETGVPTPSKLLWARGQLPDGRLLAETWSQQIVLDILKCESYTGHHSARRHEYFKHQTRLADGRVKTVKRMRMRPWTDEKRVAVPIPALVTVEQWQRVQELLTGRSLDWDRDNPDQPLLNRGFAVCGFCGGKMVSARHSHTGQRAYLCPRRGGGRKPGDPAFVCEGGHFEVRAKEVDADIWEKVKAVIRDDERFQRLVQGKSAKLAEWHAEAVERAEREARELAETTVQRDTVYRRMMAETDDGIAAMHRAELQRLNAAIAGLAKRVAEAQDTVEAVQVKRDTHKELLAWVDSLIAEANAKIATMPPEKRALAMHVRDKWFVSERDEIEEATLDSLDREQRRSVLRLLGVRVPMYPKNSEFARTHEYRWDFEFSDAALLSQESPWGW